MPYQLPRFALFSLIIGLSACNSTGGSDPIPPLEPIPLASEPEAPCSDCDNDNKDTAGDTTDERETPVQPTPDNTRALWVWGSQVVVNSDRQNTLFGLIEDKSLNRLYLEASEALRFDPQALAGFFQRAERAGVAVELLFGQPDWALAENHHHVMTWVDRTVDFAQRYPDISIAAIHLDVEPYLLPEWDSERQSLASSFVHMLSSARNRANQNGLELWADIPVWYDEHGIFYDGRARPLHELVIDATDGVGLMDYRDQTQRIINDASNELSYASQQNRPMIVGVETLCIEPQWITFCEEGSAFMEQTLRQVDSTLRDYRAYKGTAIHHFDSYLNQRR